MAKRPVFVPCEDASIFKTIYTEFSFNFGHTPIQKQKNVSALHKSFQDKYGETPLEISTKSLQPYGKDLSAFNLTKFVPSLEYSVPLECVYQGSKVFEHGGPFTDLYKKTPREAKKDSRLTSSGKVISFSFEGKSFDAFPTSCFFDWIYIRALLENPELCEAVLSYSAFTDIEFVPSRSINCQARAVAVFVALSRMNMINKTENYDKFRALFLEEKKTIS